MHIQSGAAAELKAQRQQSGLRLETLVKNAMDSVQEATHESVQQCVDSLYQKAIEDHESVKQHVTELVSGSLDKTAGGQRSISQRMVSIEESLRKLSKDNEYWHAQVTKYQLSLEEAKAEGDRAEARAAEAQEELQRIDATATELKDQLQKAQTALKKACH